MKKVEKFKILVEVTAVLPRTFWEFSVEIKSVRPSCNDWFDLIIEGTKLDLIRWINAYFDDGLTEAEDYFNENIVRI
jgi:hypothetical protein